jgi:hypothetical protein
MIIIFGCDVVVVVVVVVVLVLVLVRVFQLWNLKVWKLYCLLALFFLCFCLLALFIGVHAVSIQQSRFLLIFMQICGTAFFFVQLSTQTLRVLIKFS